MNRAPHRSGRGQGDHESAACNRSHLRNKDQRPCHSHGDTGGGRKPTSALLQAHGLPDVWRTAMIEHSCQTGTLKASGLLGVHGVFVSDALGPQPRIVRRQALPRVDIELPAVQVARQARCRRRRRIVRDRPPGADSGAARGDRQTATSRSTRDHSTTTPRRTSRAWADSDLNQV